MRWKPITRLLTNGQVGLYKFLSIALEMEKRIEQWVRELHDLAETKCDVLTTEFVELHCLCDQMQMIKMLVHHLRLIRSYPYGWVYDNDPTVKEMISELMDVIRATPEHACLPETLMRIPTGGPLLSVLKTI
ncbi:hypothetical protein FGIG_06498 [Fasciola gigantica]|uniref:Uncharacterized protein n=1 Tax=Fasciola gigantica TaxID=46835 RepID=A0A504Y7C6_FASGI|nr:hypothetical protein FGIG_06498 [Fasciola gigantica]